VVTLVMQNVTVQSTSQATFDVESSEEHFAIINIVNGMTPVLEPVTKEVFDENRLKAKSIFKYQESKEFPINRASITANKKGYLLTNFHVIDKAKKITVKGIHGDFSISFEAQVVGTDSRTDLALLRINSKLISFPEPPYAFVSTKGVQQGESVVALGYPIKQVMGEEVKVTSGIINAKSGYKGAISEYQFSAAVQPGNSGGPLLNGAGQVIGMVSAKLDADVAESVGYAVKADHLMFFLDQFDSVTYRKDETSGAAKPLPEIVSTNSPFVYIIETD
jgi:S1-C subfamily serine protease